jgi:hypothetical protein
MFSLPSVPQAAPNPSQMLALVTSIDTSGWPGEVEEGEGRWEDCQLQKLANEVRASVDIERSLCSVCVCVCVLEGERRVLSL